MKKVHKLMLKSYLGPMFLSFFIVTFVLLMNFLWRYIDELVGKGLSFNVILELVGYAAMTMIPMGLPLATLFASIMTMGNLGENNELLALKSAGISLLHILKPVAFVMIFISIGSYFAANNLVPYAFKKSNALIYDIRNQKQQLEFEDGIFFNGIDNMNIRVNHQDPKSGLLTGILIYDNRNREGRTNTTVADSGYIKISDDKKYLLVTLYNGENYDENRTSTWYDDNNLKHNLFSLQQGVIPLDGYDFERTDASLFSNLSTTKRVSELRVDADSLQKIVDRDINGINSQIIDQYIFTHNRQLMTDTLELPVKMVNLNDSVENLRGERRYQVVETALQSARNSASIMNFDETTLKDNLVELYKDRNEIFKKFALPFSILIFFLIGAPLGAIIRKGGLGMPIVISVIFFVFYYVIMISGEKMAREGTVHSFIGTWLSSFVLLPIALFLTYKAKNDSGLMDTDWYYLKMKQLKSIIHTGLLRIKQLKNGKLHEQ